MQVSSRRTRSRFTLAAALLPPAPARVSALRCSRVRPRWRDPDRHDVLTAFRVSVTRRVWSCRTITLAPKPPAGVPLHELLGIYHADQVHQGQRATLRGDGRG